MCVKLLCDHFSPLTPPLFQTTLSFPGFALAVKMSPLPHLSRLHPELLIWAWVGCSWGWSQAGARL